MSEVLEKLETLIVAISKDPRTRNNFIIRGSALFRQRINPTRVVKDLDVYVAPDYFDQHGLNEYATFVEHFTRGIIASTPFVVLCVTPQQHYNYQQYKHVQFKLGLSLDDPTPVILDVGRDADGLPYEPFDYRLSAGAAQITVSPVIVDLAWKIQLIIHARWRPKDVLDANVLRDYLNCTFDPKIFSDLLSKVMKFCGTPPERLMLLVERKFGKSSSARQKWRKWHRQNPGNDHVLMQASFDRLYDWVVPTI